MRSLVEDLFLLNKPGVRCWFVMFNKGNIRIHMKSFEIVFCCSGGCVVTEHNRTINTIKTPNLDAI